MTDSIPSIPFLLFLIAVLVVAFFVVDGFASKVVSFTPGFSPVERR
jgi:hypothetical protein